jgi:serine/threonine protein kinase
MTHVAPIEGGHVVGVDAGGAESPVGRTLAGRYVLRAEIGSGGMAGVYAGEDVLGRQPVAIKLARRPWRADRSALLREAVITSHVQGPNIVTILDTPTDPELGLFIVMEKLRGEDLAAHIDQVGFVAAPIACELGYQLA